MKMKQRFKIVSALLSAVLFLSFTLVKAEVMGHIETLTTDIVTEIVISPNGKYVFTSEVGNDATNTLTRFLVIYERDNKTGKLTKKQSISESQFETLTTVNYAPNHFVISADSKHLYMSAGDFVLHFTIEADGSINYTGNKVDTGTGSYDLKMSRGEHFIISGSSDIHVISRGVVNGNISLRSSLLFQNPGNDHQTTPGWYSISPDGTTVYASSALGGGHLYALALDKSAGTLSIKEFYVGKGIEADYAKTKHQGEIEITQGAGRSLVSSDGKFLYTVGGKRNKDTGEGAISIFKIKANGTLQPYKNVLAPKDVETGGALRILYSSDQYIKASVDGKFIYISDDVIGSIGVWRRSSSTGDLKYVGLINVDKSPVGKPSWNTNEIAVSSDGKHFYASVGNGENGIAVFDMRADLALVKQGPSTDVAPNGTMSYTLAVTNNAPSDAQNVVVTDTLPAGTSFISGTVNSPVGECIANGQKVTCTMGQIFANDGYNAIIQVKAPATEGKVTNTASVTSDQLDTKTANNTDSVTSTVKKGGATNPPVKGGGGGGSLPLSMLLLLIPALMRRRVELS